MPGAAQRRAKVDGALIKRAMREHGYTSTTLAAKLGKSSKTVERYCSGAADPPLDQALLLLSLLSLSPATLFSEERSPTGSD
jgi:predicted transcriptional regulator